MNELLVVQFYVYPMFQFAHKVMALHNNLKSNNEHNNEDILRIQPNHLTIKQTNEEKKKNRGDLIENKIKPSVAYQAKRLNSEIKANIGNSLKNWHKPDEKKEELDSRRIGRDVGDVSGLKVT